MAITFGEISTALSVAAGQSVRVNAAGTAWEAYTALTIGDAVSGGTANRVLFIDGSGNLADSANLTFASDLLTVASVTVKDEFILDSGTGDLVSLYQDRFGLTTMYGFGIGSSATYYKAPSYHRFYISANDDAGVSAKFEISGSTITNALDAQFDQTINIGSNLATLTGVYPLVINDAAGGLIFNRDHATNEPFIRLTNNGASSGFQIRGITAGGVRVTDRGGTTEWARISTSGNMGVGTGSTISARIHVISTTEQLRVGYDASNYYSTTVASNGGVTFNAVGAGAKFTFSDALFVGYDIEVTDENAGFILEDRNDATRYRLYVDSGTLSIEAV